MRSIEVVFHGQGKPLDGWFAYERPLIGEHVLINNRQYEVYQIVWLNATQILCHVR